MSMSSKDLKLNGTGNFTGHVNLRNIWIYDIKKYLQQQKQTKKLSPCFSAQFVLVTTTKMETLRFL